MWKLEKTVQYVMDNPENKQINKQINPIFSLEAQMIGPKLSYFGYTMQRLSCFEKLIMLEKVEGSGRKEQPAAKYIYNSNECPTGRLKTKTC